jgi:transposase
MSTAMLRDENELLKALLAQTQAALGEHQAALATSEEAWRRLEVILGELRRETFGAKSEKLRPDQYHLLFEYVEIAQGVLDAAQEKAAAIIQGRSRGGSDRSGHRNRGRLPAHLPRVERIIEPASTLCPCGCDGAMTKIGEDVSERLDVVPAQWRVLVTRRPKYVCGSCSGTVVQALAPERVVPGGLPTEAAIGQVIVSMALEALIQPHYPKAGPSGRRSPRRMLGL